MSFTPLNLLLFLIPQDELGKPGAARKTLPFIPHPPTASEARLPLAPDKPHSGFESLADCKAHFRPSQAQAVGFLKMDTSTVRRCKSIKRKTVEIYNPALIL